MILYGYIAAFAYGIICLLSAAVLYKMGMPKIYTRKFVHILVGFEWVILYIFHGATYHFLIVCLAFLALLVVVAAKKLMPMISSDSDNAPGTVYYAVSMSIMACACLFYEKLMIPFGIAVFCTSFGDGFAAIVGQAVKRYNPTLYKNKSLFGTLANFILCVIAIIAFKHIFALEISYIYVCLIAIFAVELEIFTGKGIDNITLPLGTFILTAFVMFYPYASEYILPIILTLPVVAFVDAKKLLSSFGIVVAFALDVIVSISLGNFGFILLLLFLALGALSDGVKKRTSYADFHPKREARTQAQVMANALVAAVCAVSFKTTESVIFAVAFAASLAEALADTLSSSFGSLSKKTFDIFKMKKCQKGLSGGMSLIGTLSALVGAAFMGGVCILFGYKSFRFFLSVTVAAFAGTVFDSFLGSVFQAKYKCRACGKITEKLQHCNNQTDKYSGFSIISNNAVNFLSTAFAAILAATLYVII